MNYGERIRQLRKQCKISAEKLGNEIGLSQSMTSKIENNERNLDIHVVKTICNALNLTLAEFFAEPAEQEDISPEVRRIYEKIKQLPPKRLQILETVLDD